MSHDMCDCHMNFTCVAFQLIELIKDEILPSSTRAPKDFLRQLTSILNRGSIHSATDQFNGEWAVEGRGREGGWMGGC